MKLETPLHVDALVGLPVAYINLDDHAKRRAAMQDTLAEHGVQATRFSATRWNDLPATEQARLYSDALNRRQFHTPLVAGEKGCYASHLMLCQALLDTPFAGLVVLEDDASLSARFAPALRALVPELHRYDMVKLLGRPKEKLRTSLALDATTAIVEYARVPSLTAGHVITRAGAKKLLASRIPFGRPIDVDLRHWWENQMVIRGLHPAVIALSSHSQTSSIGAKGDESRATVRLRKFQVKLIYSLRNAWHARQGPRP